MATLTNPINAQNIIDRFEDYVRATANSGIVWHNSPNPFNIFGPRSISKPFAEFPDGILGPLPGQSRSISGAGFPGTLIRASTIYNALIAETNRYTQVRAIRAILQVLPQSPSLNTTRPASDSVDVTAIAHHLLAPTTIFMPGNYQILPGFLIKAGGKPDRNSLEDFFFDLRAAYVVTRNVPILVAINVCHSSCHASCHGSRGRR